MNSGPSTEKVFRSLRLIIISLFVVSPVIYVVVALYLNIPKREDHGEGLFLFYSLLVIAVVLPFAGLLIERMFIHSYRKKPVVEESPGKKLAFVRKIKGVILRPFLDIGMVRGDRNKPLQEQSQVGLFTSIAILKASFVHAAYVLGLAVYMIRGDFLNMLSFYPIGIAWSYIVWPTRKRMAEFQEKVAS